MSERQPFPRMRIRDIPPDDHTLVDGQRWGEWTLRLTHGYVLLQNEWYEVDLTEIRDHVRSDKHTGHACASALDWICQVAKKTWATNDTIGNLVRAMNELLDCQSTMCSGGACRKGNPRFLEWTTRSK